MSATDEQTAVEVPTITAPLRDDETADEWRDRQMGVLMAHMRTQTSQLAQLVVAQSDVSRRLDKGAARMDRLDQAIAEHARLAAESAERTEARIQALADASAARGVAIDRRLDTMQAELASNTAITQTIAARRTWWRGFKDRVSRLRWWVVGISSTVASVLVAWWELAKLLGRGGGGVGPGP